MEFDIWHLEIKQFLELECDIGSETYKQIPSIIATDIWKYIYNWSKFGFKSMKS